MIEHCSRELPYEACGLLSGNSDVIHRIWKVKNIDQSPDSFTMDQKEMNHALCRMKSKSEELLGIYHSHPSSIPYPSKNDILYFNDPSLLYFIVSFAFSTPRLKCYLINKDLILNLPITKSQEENDFLIKYPQLA